MMAQSALALRKLEPDHKARRNITKAIDSARSGADLTRQLLAYAGHSSFLIEPFNLNELVQTYVGLLESLIRHGERLEFNLTDPLPTIEADCGQIQQVLMNLVINASEAITHDHGVIRISTGQSELGAAQFSGNQAKSFVGDIPPPGQYVGLVVEDNGQGMDVATLERIFDPYFTTKEAGHGLGLSAIVGIVRALGGGLCVTSKIGLGTTFFVYLPVSARLPLPKVAPSSPSQLSAHSETILVVDDEASILELATEVLHDAGYNTLIANNGDEGVAILRQNQQSIDAVLLDIHMPGMNGVDAFHHMRETMPDVPIILSSGYTKVDLTSRLAELTHHEFLPKPYSVDDLLDKLKSVLHGTNLA